MLRIGPLAGAAALLVAVAVVVSAAIAARPGTRSTAAQTNTATVSHSDRFDPNVADNTASATETPA